MNGAWPTGVLLNEVCPLLFLPFAPSWRSRPADRANLDRCATRSPPCAHRRHQAARAATIDARSRTATTRCCHLRLGFIAYRSVRSRAPRALHAAAENSSGRRAAPDWPYAWSVGTRRARPRGALHARDRESPPDARQGFSLQGPRRRLRGRRKRSRFASAVVDLPTRPSRSGPARLEVALDAVRIAAASPAGRHARCTGARARGARSRGSRLRARRLPVLPHRRGDSGVGLWSSRARCTSRAAPSRDGPRTSRGARAHDLGRGTHAVSRRPAWIAVPATSRPSTACPTPGPRSRWLSQSGRGATSPRRATSASGSPSTIADGSTRGATSGFVSRLVTTTSPSATARRRRVRRPRRDLYAAWRAQPARRASAQGNLEPNASWLYRRIEGDGGGGGGDDPSSTSSPATTPAISSWSRAWGRAGIQPRRARGLFSDPTSATSTSRATSSDRAVRALGRSQRPREASWHVTGSRGAAASPWAPRATATPSASICRSISSPATSWWRRRPIPWPVARHCTSSSPFPPTG